MYGNQKLFAGIFIGSLIAIVTFCLGVGIASAVNEITFAEQIVEWFGTTAPAVDGEVVEDVVEPALASLRV